jgi:hypothetical protein
VAVPALSIHAQQMVPTTSGSPLERAYARACRRPLLPLVLAGDALRCPHGSEGFTVEEAGASSWDWRADAEGAAGEEHI